MIANCRLILLVLLSGIVLLTASSKLSAQGPSIKQIGLPFMTHYGPADYDFHNNNFAVLAGQDGRMYFGNYEGVLIYDGTNWSKITLPGGAPVYGLAQSQDGKIYVGGTNEIGYLESNNNGMLNYHSFMDRLQSDSLSSFTTVPIVLSNGKVIFPCSFHIVVIDPNDPEMEVVLGPWTLTEEIPYSFHVAQDQFLIKKNDTLFRLDGQQWESIRKTELLGEFGHTQLVDVSDQQTLAITQDGFFDFESEEKISIDIRTEQFLSTAYIYKVNLLQDRYLAISTWKGLLITDLNGTPIKLLDKERGLSDNYLFGSAIDSSGMLWVATYNGVDKIDIFSPYSYMDSQMGIEGVVIDTRIFKEQLLLGSISGLITADWNDLFDPMIIPQFQHSTHTISHGFASSADDLIVLTELEPNLYVDDGELIEVEGTEDMMFWNGFISKTGEDAFLGSLQGRMVHLTKNDGKWNIKSLLDPLFQSAQFMTEGTDDDIWVGNDQEGVFKIDYDYEKGKIISDKKYGEADGLPSDFNNYVFRIAGQPIFSSELGLYRYDESTDGFLPDEQFTDLVGEKRVVPVTQSLSGEVYYFADSLFQLRKQRNVWTKIKLPAFDFRKSIFNNITAVDSVNVLISTSSGVIHLNPRSVKVKSSLDLKVTSISNIQNPDSLYFGGFAPLPEQFDFSSNQKDLRFRFSLLDYSDETKNTYRWRLKGYDEDWSDWSSDTQKDYTNLAHGDYTFEVMGMNLHGEESEPTLIPFTIETPFFFTIWAYLTYVFAFFLLIWVIVKMYTRKIRADRDRLEKVVEERTVEINEQKNELLKMDDLKKRFFVNISHELRTPLTLSMGTVDQALKGTYGNLNDELYANLQVSKRNSERLLKMVTSILDISKLEGGRIQLYAASVDPSDTVSKVLAFFSSRLEDKHISLEENLIQGSQLYIDQDKFETILINLLSNAFKFTPDGGVISFTMKDMPDEIIFEIRDSGSGIPESDLNLVFDRFYQSPTIKSGEGMGVGLALTKELVELHHGTVGAKNDNGAVFTLAFPKGKEHLTPNQIVDHQESATERNIADKYPLHDDPTITVVPEKELDSHAEHILLVEDNIEMRQFISGILSPHYEVSWAEDGAKGLEFLKETKPDLIITDYLMPNMDGYEMATEIKKSDELAFIPIVFLTARAREQDKINVLNLGVDDYLYKPFSTDELLVRVKNLLFNKKHRAEYIEEQEIDSSQIEWKDFDSKIKQDIDGYIQVNIKSEITGDDLAKIAGHSERSLYRKVKANTGLSLMLYVKEYRLRQARSLLENKELPTVSEVSYAVGFNYLSHFTKSYKERFGKQPSEYLE